MAHCTKFVRAATRGMFIHYDRTAEHKLSNQDIDHERTHLNYNLAFNDQPLNQSVFLKKRLSEITTNGRKTQNVMCDWIVTLPVEVKSEDEERFFKETYDFLSEKYGRENVISAYVHKDETTPHLHFAFVPVETTEQGEKLNAKAIINRNTLRTFHREYSKCINSHLGYDCGVVNGITKKQGGNKTIAELKANNYTYNINELILFEMTERNILINFEHSKEDAGVYAIGVIRDMVKKIDVEDTRKRYEKAIKQYDEEPRKLEV